MHEGAYGAGTSSSSKDRREGPDVNVVSGKRQVNPSVVDVASSAELLSRLIIAVMTAPSPYQLMLLTLEPPR